MSLNLIKISTCILLLKSKLIVSFSIRIFIFVSISDFKVIDDLRRSIVLLFIIITLGCVHYVLVHCILLVLGLLNSLLNHIECLVSTIIVGQAITFFIIASLFWFQLLLVCLYTLYIAGNSLPLFNYLSHLCATLSWKGCVWCLCISWLSIKL